MSKGNQKTEGGKGRNYPFQLNVLKGLQQSLDALNSISSLISTSTGISATESTLQSVLAAIQNGTDYEAELVTDDNDETWLEVRFWNTGSQTFDPPVYYAAGSNIIGTPAAPINYINPLTLLATIANNTTGLNLETTQELIRLLLVSLDNKDFATETTLQNVDAKLNAAQRTPNIIRVTDSGTINQVVYSFSVANVGGDDGIILGAVIKDGEVISFDAGSLNNFYASGSITYDAAGTEFIVIYNT